MGIRKFIIEVDVKLHEGGVTDKEILDSVKSVTTGNGSYHANHSIKIIDVKKYRKPPTKKC